MTTGTTRSASLAGWWGGTVLMAIPVAVAWAVAGGHLWPLAAGVTVGMAVAWTFSHGVASHAPWRREGSRA